MSALGRVRQWVWLEGSRLVLTALVLAGVFLLLGPVSHLFIPETANALTEANVTTPLLSTLLSGVFLLVSIVVSINALFVTREQVPLGQQSERLDAVSQFRDELSALVGETVTPADPARLVQSITGTVVTNLQTVRERMDDRDTEAIAEIERLLDDVATETSRVNERMHAAETPLDVVVATLDYDYGRQADELRRVRAEHGDALDAEARETIDTTLELLRHSVAAREYFKTLYFTREFARLSNYLVYVSFGAILVVSFTLTHAPVLPDAHVLLTAVHTVALAPFVLLSTYVVRVGTIATRTRAAGEFVVDTEPFGDAE
jgi:hypothetical protein